MKFYLREYFPIYSNIPCYINLKSYLQIFLKCRDATLNLFFYKTLLLPLFLDYATATVVWKLLCNTAYLPAGKFSFSRIVVVRVLLCSCGNDGGMWLLVLFVESSRSPWCFLWLSCRLYGFTFSTCFGTEIQMLKNIQASKYKAELGKTMILVSHMVLSIGWWTSIDRGTFKLSQVIS